MNGVAFSLRFGLLWWPCLALAGEVADHGHPILRVESIHPIELSVQLNEKKSQLSLPVEFERGIAGLYRDVYVEDLNGDGVKEIVFRMEEGGVNACSRVLSYGGAEKGLSELIFGESGLCNFKVRDGYVISAYREGALWKEQVYRISDGLAVLKVADSCVGCGEVKREIHGADGSISRLLVSDGYAYESRLPLSAIVFSSRASIFTSPEASAQTEKYLVEGNKVILLEYSMGVDNEEWYEFRFSGAENIGGWIRCGDLDVCNK